MSRYTPEQIAAIRAESERLLRGEPPARPKPTPPPRAAYVPEADPVQEWRDWHDQRAAERKANRAEVRREEGDNACVLSALGRIAALEARIAQLEQSVAQSDASSRELAQGTVTFAESVDQGMVRMEKHLAELSDKLSQMRRFVDVRPGAGE